MYTADDVYFQYLSDIIHFILGYCDIEHKKSNTFYFRFNITIKLKEALILNKQMVHKV